MNEETWTPDSAFRKAWSFVKYASKESARTSDPVAAIVLTGAVWLIYFPAVMVIFPLISFVWFLMRKMFR